MRVVPMMVVKTKLAVVALKCELSTTVGADPRFLPTSTLPTALMRKAFPVPLLAVAERHLGVTLTQ
jgi:hypothetical protein